MTVYTPGTYVCVNIGGFVGWCIKHATHSDADHAFMVLDEQGTILESQPDKIHGRTGAHINNIREYAGLDMWVSNQAIVTEPGALAAVAKDYVGIRYGFPDIVLLGVQTTFHWTPWPLDKVVQSENRMICSQLVASFGQHFGMTDWLCGQTCDQYVTPGMLKARGTVPL